MLKEGQKAPSFELFNEANQVIKLSDFSGKKLVLYFYPKDDTPGCTKEAIEFGENKKVFDEKNTIVIGISKDSVTSHQKFCTKYQLMIPLLSDPEKQTIEDYGVWQEKKNYGKTYMGIVRSTFLIDETGHIKQIWDNVRVAGHVDAVLESL
jgi:peroxiredoxin Q/BCP